MDVASSNHFNLRIHDVWAANADPLVDSMPFVNNDIWMVALCLAGNAVCRLHYRANTSSKKRQATVESLVFLYHCFICGLSFAAMLVVCILTDWETHVVTCIRLQTFSNYGFAGKVKIYIVYIAFLVKLCQVIECIWCRSSLAQAVTLTEGVICLLGLKFDATAHVWLAGVLHLPFLLFTSYFNAISISRTEDPHIMFQIRRRLVYLFLTTESCVGLMHTLYTMSRSDCAFPRHWSLFALFYPLVAWATYQHIYITPYAPRMLV